MSSNRTRRHSARASRQASSWRHHDDGVDLVSSGSSDEAEADADEIFGDAAASSASKLEQLCVQVGEAVAMALATASDGQLRDLGVASVTAARGAACLRVTLVARQGSDPGAILRRLQRAAGYLRGEVADSVHRRRVPDLIFTVTAGNPDGDGGDDGEVQP
jgi:hypothetical protein